MTMRNTLFSLSLAAGMMALASQASASEPAQPAISVAYHDLDLASDTGRAELDRRSARHGHAPAQLGSAHLRSHGQGPARDPSGAADARTEPRRMTTAGRAPLRGRPRPLLSAR